jgi:urease accessory protein
MALQEDSNGPAAQGYGPARSWPASLNLDYAPKNGRTALVRMDFRGPLRVQRPFYPEGAVCHTYLLHPPGGLVSGDALTIRIAARPGAHALLTTPSAGKVYGADSHGVAQRQEVQISAEDSLVEWTPMETIVFDRANAHLSVVMDLSGNARCIGWEILCLGRPESGRPFTTGAVVQKLEIRRDNRPLLLERQTFAGGASVMTDSFGLAGAPVTGTLFATGPDDVLQEALAKVREALSPAPDSVCASTHRCGVLLTRYRGDSAEEARRLFARAWAEIRPVLLGRKACPPRIWTT